MDKDEIDRLVKATKAKTEAQEQEEDVDMSGTSSSRPGTHEEAQPSRPTPQPKTIVRGS
jgi:hypothetical protein